LRLSATAALEEWSHISLARGQNPAYRPSGALTGWHSGHRHPRCPLMVRRTTRSLDWGFPRWREYGSETAATTVRLCDRYGCEAKGDKPAPKAPNSPDRWYFCETHAGEYNRNWDYFQGLTPEEAAAREAQEQAEAGGWRTSAYQQWAGPGDGTRSSDEMRALGVLQVASDASFEDIRLAWRGLAKANHPDLKPNDAEAAARFREIQAAWDVVRSAEERREAVRTAT
jgi:hypothetical protein